MSDYKTGLLSRFGLGAVKFNFDDLRLKNGEDLPAVLVGQEVYIRKISGEEFEQFAADHADLAKDDGALVNTKFRGIRATMIQMCLCDPDGAPVFETVDEANQQLNNEFIGAAFVACQQVNGIGVKAQEEAEKN